MRIIKSRLEGVQGDIVDPDAIQFASRKVAAVSGDARRALDICRRAVEIVEYAASRDSLTSMPSTPSKNSRGFATASTSQTTPSPRVTEPQGKVTIAVIKQAINEATSSPLQHFLRCLPLAAKVFLAAAIVRIHRSGMGDNAVGDVIDEAERMIRTCGDSDIEDLLCNNSKLEARSADWRGGRVEGLMGAAIMLMEAGIIGLEVKRGERAGRLRLNVGEEEISSALREDREVRKMMST